MILEVTMSVVLSVFGLLISFISMLYARGQQANKQIKEIEHRLTSMEVKLDPLWEAICKEIPNLLISPHTEELDKLIENWKNGRVHMPKKDLRRLLELLDAEYKVAVTNRDRGLGVGIALMRAGVRGTLNV